ncbi:hypothetical protein BC936DRAFT_147775 [Jimgerdemannia flammicorona]|uniref:Uncharacterized protein n=1 Tax=Jimgerdemannia flammicorona TaxID=994334 RepID=A0A433DKT3_9FUNG|nr:hypothetical protein BC936DRAFT_147775 [Jimgerdemannia flammicorona]
MILCCHGKRNNSCRFQVLLESTEEGLLLRDSLEATVTELGRSIHKLKGDLLKGRSLSMRDKGLAEGEDALLCTDASTLDHDEVLVDITVVGEPAQGRDGFLGDIELGGAVELVGGLADAVDFLVELHTVMITTLTGTGDGVHDAGRMPSADTSDLAKALVGFAGKLFGTVTVGDTLETVTLGDADDVDHLVLLEDGVDVDRLLEVLTGPLDLHDVGFFLADLELANLGVGQDAYNGAVLLDALELAVDLLGTLGVLLGVFGEGLLFGAVPVLVEATLKLLRQVLGPDGGEGAEAAGSLDVADDTDDDKRGGLDDGNGLDDLLLVHLYSPRNNLNFMSNRFLQLTPTTFQFADNVSHTGLVAQEGSQVDGPGLVVLREGLDLSAVAGSALPRQETQRTVAGRLELTMRLYESKDKASVWGGFRMDDEWTDGWMDGQHTIVNRGWGKRESSSAGSPHIPKNFGLC